MLDPGIQILQWLARVSGRSFRPEAPVAAVRAGYRDLNARFGMRPVDDVTTTRVEIPVRDASSILAHLHVPAAPLRTPIPVLLYFHGGGWVIGDVAAYDHLTRYFAHEGRIAVLSVDYRKGPEHPIPTGFDDGFDAYAWLVAQASAYGLDASRIAIGGDSAGAAIAAAISTYAPQQSLPIPAFQYLIYPPVDGSLRYPSRQGYRKGDMIVPAMRTWFAKHALADLADRAHPYLMLIDAPQIEHLPPTYFLAAGYDALVDEGRAYVERLRAAGVNVTYDLAESLPHGLANVPRVSARARKALRAGILATSRALA
jgi:acetyl esterase